MEKFEPDMENMSQIWIWHRFSISGSDFSYLAQISGLSGLKLSKIRDVLVMIVVYCKKRKPDLIFF